MKSNREWVNKRNFQKSESKKDLDVLAYTSYLFIGAVSMYVFQGTGYQPFLTLSFIIVTKIEKKVPHILLA